MPSCDARAATHESVFSDVIANLPAQYMLSIYSVEFDTIFADEHEHLTVSLEFDESEWSERPLDDGLVLVVAYAAPPHSAQEAVSVY